MHSYTAKKLPKNSVEISVTLPKEDVKKGKEHAFAHLQSELVVEGFRKGKVPSAIAQKYLTSEAIYQEMMKEVLPNVYDEIVKKEALKPVMNPKVELLNAKEGEDWQIKISVAQKPTITLGDYKAQIKNLKAGKKKEDIWVPGKEPAESGKKEQEAEKSKMINDVLDTVLKTAKIEVSDLILEEELNHRLSRLVDDVEKIGLTVDGYLKSKNLTMETIKAQFKKEIEDTYKLEFILAEIADVEGIKVEPEELNRLFVNIKNEKEKQSAMQNSYYYASILRKQKTLDYLIGL